MLKSRHTLDLNKTKEFALLLHKDHKRIAGNSYFDHVQEVVDVLQEHNVEDEAILVAAYLHHALDFGNTSETDLHNNFGEEVTNLVKNYKKLSESELSLIAPNEVNEKYIIQTFLNQVSDPKNLIIRLADKVNNIKSTHVLPKDKAKSVAERALYIYAPICRFLGSHLFVRTLEDEALKILNPREYYRIHKYLRKRGPVITQSLLDTTKFIEEILKEKGMNPQVDSRVKHIYSIYKKVNDPKYKLQIHKLPDIAAIRILVDTLEQCYHAEGLLNKLWDSIADVRDDYIQKPKPSGYKGLHITYRVSKKMLLEVQIKTYAMHEKNEFGLANHTFYKIGGHLSLKKQLEENPDWLKEMNYKLQGNKIKIDHFTKNIYVFTPKGDIIELQRGANLIDFAYAIHDDLGNSCTGGIINGDLQKLTHALNDGDRVEIRTSKSRKMPSRDWLKEVKTKKAKSGIKKALNKKRKGLL